jgi:hypothetical protein
LTRRDIKMKPSNEDLAICEKYRVAERMEFEEKYGRWLAARAAITIAEDPGDELYDALEAARDDLLSAEPPLKWLIWYKFEVLEHVLGGEDRAGARDRGSEIRTLAAIKADLLHFGFDDP